MDLIQEMIEHKSGLDCQNWEWLVAFKSPIPLQLQKEDKWCEVK